MILSVGAVHVETVPLLGRRVHRLEHKRPKWLLERRLGRGRLGQRERRPLWSFAHWLHRSSSVLLLGVDHGITAMSWNDELALARRRLLALRQRRKLGLRRLEAVLRGVVHAAAHAGWRSI